MNNFLTLLFNNIFPNLRTAYSKIYQILNKDFPLEEQDISKWKLPILISYFQLNVGSLCAIPDVASKGQRWKFLAWSKAATTQYFRVIV